MQRLQLFGGISIQTEQGPLTGRAVQRRRLALLALLAAARGRGVSRDRLIAHLWPAADAENGRRFLSDSVYRINQALGGDVIVAAGDDLRLAEQRLPSDLADFESALARGEHEEAVGVYGGPLLDGFHLSDAPEFERWVDGERDRLARAYADALEALAERAERAESHAAAAGWWRRLAVHDPYSSRIALRLMQALAAAGDRGAAIQHARVHEALLRADLEVEPDPAVRTLTEQLRRDDVAPDAAGERRVRAADSPADGAGAPPPPVPAEPAADPAPADAPPADASPAVAAPALPAPAAPAAERGARRRTPRLIAVALLLLALVAGVGWLAWRGGRGAADPAPGGPRSIAVLPFANLGPQGDDEYFSDGITEELIATLGRVEGLEVASRTSVFAYKNRPSDVREVGRRLGVGAVVEGSVRRAGRRLRITAQLVSTANGYTLWTDTFDRELDDVFAIQEEISRAIVAHLTGRLAGPASVRLAERYTQDPEAYDLYLKGRFAWHRRTRDGLRDAVEYFGRAAARAPDYARAYAGLGDAYAVSAFYDFLAPDDAYPKAEAAARRALALDPTLAAPHATLGYVLTYYQQDWAGAEAEFRRALAIDPGYSTAHQWYANLLTVAARFDEAEREFRAAQEADPLSLIANAALGWSFYLAGRHEEALEQCRRALALEPNFELAHLWGGWALEEMGRRRESREWIERAVRLSDGGPNARLALAHVLARSGAPSDTDSARTIVREIERRRASGEYMPSYEIGKVHLALGDREAALEWLGRAVAERSHSRAFLTLDPQLAPLRGDPRFRALMARRQGR
ncbi:MAG TPA: tetratricopeptide repeat protein [Gemmatimonadaceae bacterium]|nr:tetratricopeptide repeat protein [Gemmatimonadaceae bacterium]